MIWLVDEHEKLQVSEKVEHIDDCEHSGMHGAWVDDDSGELSETGVDEKVIA